LILLHLDSPLRENLERKEVFSEPRDSTSGFSFCHLSDSPYPPLTQHRYSEIPIYFWLSTLSGQSWWLTWCLHSYGLKGTGIPVCNCLQTSESNVKSLYLLAAQMDVELVATAKHPSRIADSGGGW